jgi:pyruvate,water dikinase
MMCEYRRSILAGRFLEHFDGFSIGSNDLSQLPLGLDRDSGMPLLAADFDERDPALKAIYQGLPACRYVHRRLRQGLRAILTSRSGW